MRRMLIVLFALAAFIVLPVLASAEPIPGTYSSPSRGGNVLVGRVSVSRQYPNSGDPKVFNGQSWNGSVLGTQWEIKCGVQTTSVPPDYSQFNPVTGTGFIFYNQTFQGGTFAIYTDPLVGWGSGSGTLNTTSAWGSNSAGAVPAAKLSAPSTRHSHTKACSSERTRTSGGSR